MGILKETWDNMLRMYGVDPQSGETSGGTGRGTPDGTVQLSGRSLRENEFRKLLEAFFREHGYLPRDSDEFEQWLDS
ncbi:MAG: hypothetical protein ACE5IW_10755 [bacterium]